MIVNREQPQQIQDVNSLINAMMGEDWPSATHFANKVAGYAREGVYPDYYSNLMLQYSNDHNTLSHKPNVSDSFREYHRKLSRAYLYAYTTIAGKRATYLPKAS